jgi:hypothetical protein
MDLFFADDSKQTDPTRHGMESLVANGGLLVPSAGVKDLEQEIDELCSQTGFPPGEEFKWSPGRDLWMRRNLVERPRTNFFLQALDLAKQKDAAAIVIVEDTHYQPATDADCAEEDVVRLLIERIDWQLHWRQTKGIVIADRPGGGRSDEDEFLVHCLETLQDGTQYVQPDHIALSVLSSPSHLIRLLQLADVITSCTLAFVSGEDRYSPPVFLNGVKPLLARQSGRIGGVGLKIHPDSIYANLYHWLLGDSWLIKRGSGRSLPLIDRPYPNDATSL